MGNVKKYIFNVTYVCWSYLYVHRNPNHPANLCRSGALKMFSMASLRTTTKPSPTTRLSASSSGKCLILCELFSYVKLLCSVSVDSPFLHSECGVWYDEQTLLFLFELESSAVGIKSPSHLGPSGSAKPLLRQSGAWAPAVPSVSSQLLTACLWQPGGSGTRGSDPLSFTGQHAKSQAVPWQITNMTYTQQSWENKT